MHGFKLVQHARISRASAHHIFVFKKLSLQNTRLSMVAYDRLARWESIALQGDSHWFKPSSDHSFYFYMLLHHLLRVFGP
jgi:hypothetical protein